jgi:hypothetical protein
VKLDEGQRDRVEEEHYAHDTADADAPSPPPEDREILPPWALMVLFVLAAVLLIALILSWLGI